MWLLGVPSSFAPSARSRRPNFNLGDLRRPLGSAAWHTPRTRLAPGQPQPAAFVKKQRSDGYFESWFLAVKHAARMTDMLVYVCVDMCPLSSISIYVSHPLARMHVHTCTCTSAHLHACCAHKCALVRKYILVRISRGMWHSHSTRVLAW